MYLQQRNFVLFLHTWNWELQKLVQILISQMKERQFKMVKPKHRRRLNNYKHCCYGNNQCIRFGYNKVAFEKKKKKSNWKVQWINCMIWHWNNNLHFFVSLAVINRSSTSFVRAHAKKKKEQSTEHIILSCRYHTYHKVWCFLHNLQF
jgi:hypothetical protein